MTDTQERLAGQRQRHEDPRDVARRELRKGEKLIWADRPAPQALRRRHMTAFLFAIPFTAFACFWIWGASQAAGSSTMGSIFPLFGLPFLGVGLWMLTAPLRAARRAGSTVYAITDQRLFILRGGRTRSVQSFGPGDISKIERNEHDDGTGDVIFAEEVASHSVSVTVGYRRRHRTQVRDVGFFGIAEAREVEAAVVKLRRSVPAVTTGPA